jgi:hypothetical protein
VNLIFRKNFVKMEELTAIFNECIDIGENQKCSGQKNKRYSVEMVLWIRSFEYKSSVYIAEKIKFELYIYQMFFRSNLHLY